MRTDLWFRVIGAVLLCVTLAGCRMPVQQQLQDGYSAYRSGDDEAALRHTDEFLRDYSSSLRGGEAFYLRGMAKDRLGDRNGAKEDWTRALNCRLVNDNIRAHVLLALGDWLWRAGDLDEADKLYRRCLSVATPRRPPCQYAYYRLGNLCRHVGQWRQAKGWFDLLREEFGDSELSRLAQLKASGRAWTIQAGVFSNKTNADAVVRKFSRDSLPAEVVQSKRNGGTFYVIRVGRYDTHKQAAEMLKKVKRIERGAFVTTRK